MKRGISALLSIAMLIAYVVPTYAEDTAQENMPGKIVREIIDYDFEGYPDNMPDVLGFSPNSGYMSVEKLDEEHGNVLKMGFDQATNNQNPLAQVRVVEDENDVALSNLVFEADFCMPNKGPELQFVTRGKTASDVATLVKFRWKAADYGEIFNPGTADPDGKIEWIHYELNTWYHIKYVLNAETNKFDCWLSDGTTTTQIAKNVVASYYGSNVGITQLRVMTNSSLDTNGFVYVDNIKISEEIEFPEVTKISSEKDGQEFDDILYTADRIKVSLSFAADDDTINNQSVYITQGNETVLCDVAYENGSIYLTPLNGLKSSTEYTLTVKSTVSTESGSHSSTDQVLTFTTTAKEIDVFSGYFDVDSSYAVFNAEINNTSGSDINAVVMSAVGTEISLLKLLHQR